MAERILVVDDHPLTRDALASLLAQGGFDVVGEAADGAEAIELARVAAARPRPARPHDARAGRACRAARACARPRPRCEVVVLTASGTEENLLAAIRAGAAGYLLKSEPPERIVTFLRGVAQRRGGALGRGRAPPARPGARGGRLGGGVPDAIAAALSARELEVLLLLDEHLSTDDDRRSGCSSPSTPSART